MAFQDIVDKIRQDAQEQAERIKAEASQQADKIIREAQEKARGIKETLLQRAKQRAEEEQRRLLTLARLELRKELLQEKQNQIDSAFNKAFEHLVNLNNEAYEKLLRTLLLSAMETGDEYVIPPANGRLELIEKVLKEINSSMNKKLTLSSEKRNIAGGFILRRGRQEINYSFEAILNNIRENLEPEVAQILFQE